MKEKVELFMNYKSKAVIVLSGEVLDHILQKEFYLNIIKIKIFYYIIF